ncbi:unnamed protein product [Diatraea saccharalis]|uniref:Uncharacterized protein n=1 Tax=Diatraea saccharalis TaxID=40085 RepID=A0A9N9WJ85_9NEOP|nr:unnamed protein product [Diatraea saccharalis]
MDNLASNVSITDVRSTLNTHFSILNSLSAMIIEEIDLIVNSILFAKQNVLHPHIISPKEIYHELTSNIKILKHKEFPVRLTLEDIHILIDISTLNIFYMNFKLVFVLNIPLVTSQEYELYHVLPLPIPHTFQDLTYALVQPTKRYLGITTNRHSYVQFNNLDQCKKLSREHFICQDLNEYSAMSNPSCESLLITSFKRVT